MSVATSVAFLVDQLFARVPGGMATYIRRLVPELSAADPALDIVLFHSRVESARVEPWMRRYWTEELTIPIRTAYPAWAAVRRPRLPPALAERDVLHTPLPVAIPPAGSSQRLVVTVHDVGFLAHPQLYPRRWRALYRLGLIRAARSADAIVTVSHHTADDLVRRARVRASRVHVTPLAPSLPESRADPEPVLDRLGISRPYILFIGTLEPRKNIARLIRAFRTLRSRGARHSLVLAGAVGWNPDGMLREVRGAPPGSVVVTGHVSEADLDALHRAADAFVYPSLYEGFGLPVLDAMARGVACVVSATSSLPEVAGSAAILVDPTSALAIADALERVTSDRRLAAALGAAGIERAASFTWAETARRTLDAYGAALERTAHRR